MTAAILLAGIVAGYWAGRLAERRIHARRHDPLAWTNAARLSKHVAGPFKPL